MDETKTTEKRKPFGVQLLKPVRQSVGESKTKSTRTIRDIYGGGKETDSETDSDE
jgi:hypothetical protein